MARTPGETAAVVAAHVVAKYGLSGLRRLVRGLNDGVSGQRLADEFEVSRERVRQWKNALGVETRRYQVHDPVGDILIGARTQGRRERRPALGPQAGFGLADGPTGRLTLAGPAEHRIEGPTRPRFRVVGEDEEG